MVKQSVYLGGIRRPKAFTVVPFQDGLVCLIVVGKAIVLGVPTQFLTWETCRLDGQQCRLSNSRTNTKWSPKRLLISKAAFSPIMPMIARLHLGHGFVVHLLSLTKDFHLSTWL